MQSSRCFRYRHRWHFPASNAFPLRPANYLDWRKQNDVFDSISVYGPRAMQLGGGSRPQSLMRDNFRRRLFHACFELSRLSVARSLSPSANPGRDAVIVLSQGFAQSHFGSLAERLWGRARTEWPQPQGHRYNARAVPRQIAWFPAVDPGLDPDRLDRKAARCPRQSQLAGRRPPAGWRQRGEGSVRHGRSISIVLRASTPRRIRVGALSFSLCATTWW